ncbi:30498_t:CDS:2, partial [Racocetra persica]
EVCKGGVVSELRKITDHVLSKAEANRTLASYYVDHKDEYMYLRCYNGIVVNGSDFFKNHALEWERSLKKCRKSDNLSMSESIKLLANIIFQRDVLGENSPIVDFLQLRAFVEKKSELLTPFFDEIEAAVGMENKNEDKRQELNRSLAYQCYLMCWNRNKPIPLWNLKDEKLKSKEFMWVDGVVVLMNLLYDRKKKQNLPSLYSFQELRKEMEDKDHRLSIFFNSIYDAANPFERSEKYLEKLDKRLALNVILSVTEMSIFLNSMRTAHEAIDAFVLAGVMITSRHMDRKKADIAELHDDLVDGYLNKN